MLPMLLMLLMFSCTATLLLLLCLTRRGFKAIMDLFLGRLNLLLSGMVSSLWGLCTSGDLHAVEVLSLGDFHRVVSDVHHRLSDFIRGIVVHRRDEAMRGWRN